LSFAFFLWHRPGTSQFCNLFESDDETFSGMRLRESFGRAQKEGEIYREVWKRIKRQKTEFQIDKIPSLAFRR